MIITVLSQKYKCGCGRGISYIERSSLVPKLNAIIEWDLCEFPKKKEGDKEVEDRKFLGDDPGLSPGDCFLYDGQVIAVDSINRLVLIVSETGSLALDRILKDDILPELELKFNSYLTEDVKWEVVEDEDSVKDFDGTYNIEYNIYKIWKEHFVKGRGFLEKGMKIKAKITSDICIVPVDLILQDWSIKYKKSQLEEDEAEYVSKECISWFYNNYARIKPIGETK